MPADWLELRVTVPTPVAEACSQLLVELGSEGVVEENRGAPETELDMAPATFGELQAYFPAHCDQQQIEGQLREQLSLLGVLPQDLEQVAMQWLPVAVEDWEQDWKQHFEVQRYGPVCLCPSWCDNDEPHRPGEIRLTLDPGRAFGTGNHETTRLCLEYLVPALQKKPHSQVLDVGTGSGILALVAAAMGAPEVVATEIDPPALEAAQANALLNRLAGGVDFYATEMPPQEKGCFDIICANILLETNARLAPYMAQRLVPGGELVFSGILDRQVGSLVAICEKLGLEVVSTQALQQWRLLVCQRPVE